MKRSVLFTGLLLIGLVMTSGCSEDRSMLVDPLLVYKIGYAPTWAASLSLTDDRADDARIELLDNVIVVLEPSSRIVTVLSIEDGTILWKKVIGGVDERLIAAVRRGEELIIHSDANLYVFSAMQGKQLRSSRLQEIVKYGPVMVDNYAVFGGVTGTVFAHDVISGYSKWGYKLSTEINTRPVALAPGIFVVDNFGVMAMLMMPEGDVIWRRQPTDTITGQPVVTGVGVTIVSQDNKVYNINRATGRDRWVYRAPLGADLDPIVISGMVFQKLAQGQWIALDINNGDELWQIEGSFHSITTAKNGLLFASNNRFAIVDPINGKILKEIPVRPFRNILSGPDDSLILISQTGRLLRLDPIH